MFISSTISNLACDCILPVIIRCIVGNYYLSESYIPILNTVPVYILHISVFFQCSFKVRWNNTSISIWNIYFANLVFRAGRYALNQCILTVLDLNIPVGNCLCTVCTVCIVQFVTKLCLLLTVQVQIELKFGRITAFVCDSLGNL